jgi:Mn-containing catalase
MLCAVTGERGGFRMHAAWYERGGPAWLAAIEELKADGLEDTPVPSNFPQEREMSSVAYKFQNFSEGTESQEGRWASGPSMDGKGEFEYVADPEAMGPQMDELDPPVEPRLYSTPKQPMSPASS